MLKGSTLFGPFFINENRLFEETMKTYLAPVNEIEKKWYLVDAENKVLGRLASEIANRLRGKHKPTFSAFIDNGDFIIVTNAEKVQLTGNKLNDKKYYRHTGYMGGLKEATAKEMLVKHPTELLMRAVKGMLPKNKIGRAQLKKLKVYTGKNHPHAAQQPAALDI
jgi:large subunit ribosomal protein L13